MLASRISRLVRGFRLHYTPIRRVNLSSISFSCPYTTLGLPVGCTDVEEIQAAYAKAALASHPDVNDGDEQEFIRIREAVEQIRKNLNENDEEIELHTFTGGGGGDMVDFGIDTKTRKEVVAEYNNMMKRTGGKAIRGGAWDLARHIAEQSLLKSQEPERLAEGDTLKRRRRKR